MPILPKKQFVAEVTNGGCMVVADSEHQASEFILNNCCEGIEITKLEEMRLNPAAKYKLEDGEKTPFFLDRIGIKNDTLRWQR